MGRRSRKRGAVAATPPAPAPAAPPRRSRSARPERPKAPWHPVPLTELATLAGIVLLIIGFLDFRDRKWLLVAGLGLASLGGLDTALREHFARYRSHTSILAGVPSVALAAGLYFSKVPWPVLVVAAVGTFAGCFWWLWGFYRRGR